MRQRCWKTGFTLLEILTAMTILVIIILTMSTLFNQSSSAWDRGLQKVKLGMAGRSALNLMSREIGQAVADQLMEDYTDLGSGNDIQFYTVGGSSTNSRMLRLVRYDGGGTLRRTQWMLDPYPVPDPVSIEEHTLLDNVVGLQFGVYPPPPPLGYYSTNLPDWVDIKLTLAKNSKVGQVRCWSSGPNGLDQDGDGDDVSSEKR